MPRIKEGARVLEGIPEEVIFELSFEGWIGFPGGSDSKASACNVGDPGSSPGSGRSPGEGNGNPLQFSCLENPMDRGAWWATVHGVAKRQTRLSDFTFTSLEGWIRVHEVEMAGRAFPEDKMDNNMDLVIRL